MTALDPQPLSRPMKALLASAGGLAVVAGPVLFFFPYDTETYFAWTIAHPLTPVFMGASYLAGIGTFWAIRLNRWAVARVILPSITVFGAGELVATVLHLDVFNWSHPVAWAWLAVYVLSPPAALLLFLAAERGRRPEFHAADLPPAMRPVMSAYAVLFGVVGLALFLVPDTMGEYWPWSLTFLTARVLGGWYLASAALAAALARESRLENAGIALGSVMLVTGLLLLGAALHRAEFDGPPASVALYLAVVAAYGLSGAALWQAARRRAPAAARQGRGG
jgi:hypothetical protein